MKSAADKRAKQMHYFETFLMLIFFFGIILHSAHGLHLRFWLMPKHVLCDSQIQMEYS